MAETLLPNEPNRMKPIIILPVGAMEQEAMELLRENGICVIEAKDPAAVRFLDPIPCISSRTEIENGAIQLSRKVLGPGYWTSEDTRKTIAGTFLDILVKGTALDPKPSRAEQERQIFDVAKADELRKLAREEAKADRIAAKAKKP